MMTRRLRRGVIGKVLARRSIAKRAVAGSIPARAFRLLTERSAAYKRLTRSLQHKCQVKLQPVGRQVVRSRLAVILDTKELATPSFSGQFT